REGVSAARGVALLMREAPVGLPLSGPALLSGWVNAPLPRLSERAGSDPSAPSDPQPDPSAWTGLLPSEAWPEPVAVRAEAALRTVMDEGAPLAERGYPVMSPPAGGPAADAVPADDVCGCASWFPVHDAAGKVFGVGLIMLNVAGLSTEAAEAAAAEIRRSEERYRSLVQGGAQVVWVAAPDGAMKEDSPEWRWITGQSEEEYTGFGWLESVHPD